MYLAGVSVRRVEDITEALWGTRVSPATVSDLNKKIYGAIEAWRNRPTASTASAGRRSAQTKCAKEFGHYPQPKPNVRKSSDTTGAAQPNLNVRESSDTTPR